MENERELGRGIVHILFGIFFILAIMFDFVKIWMLAGLIILGFFLALASKHAKLPVIGFLLERFERENIRLPGKNFILFLMGIFLSLVLFPKTVCLASIAILTFLDPVSHIIGIKFGKTKTFLNKNKNIEGTLAGLIAGSLGAMLFVSPLIAFFGGLAGALFELLDLRVFGFKIDDDFLIPLVSGGAMFLLVFVTQL